MPTQEAIDEAMRVIRNAVLEAMPADGQPIGVAELRNLTGIWGGAGYASWMVSAVLSVLRDEGLVRQHGERRGWSRVTK